MGERRGSVKSKILTILILVTSLHIFSTNVLAIILNEDFDAPGSNWSGSIFTETYIPTYGQGKFERLPLQDGMGITTSNPDQPISISGDKEGTFYYGMPPEYGGIMGFALLPEQFNGADMSMDGYIGFGRATSYGSLMGSFLLRATGENGYLSRIDYGPSNQGIIYISQIRDGVVRSGYPIVPSSPFSINWQTDSVHLNVKAIGNVVEAHAWRVFEENGEIIESALVLNPSDQNDPYAIRLVDDMFDSGTAGIGGFMAGTNRVIFDDITVNTDISEPTIIVAVDIKPGSCPNPVNVKSKGVLPIAILGTEDFDVNTIDPTSIRLADVAAIRSNYEDVAGAVMDGNDCSCSEDGPDGFTDLILKFETEEIVEAIGDVNDGDELKLELNGVLFSGEPIEGSDCVVIVGSHKPFNKADINKDGVVDTIDFAIFTQSWLQSNIAQE